MRFPSTEFDVAVAELCHGTISDVGVQELHELLGADTDAQDEYLWRVEVHGKLASGNLDFERLPAVEETNDELNANATPHHDGAQVGQWPWRSTSIGFALVAVLLLIALVGEGLDWEPPGALPATPEVVGRFGALHDCRWVDSDTELRSGDVIDIGQHFTAKLTAICSCVHVFRGIEGEPL